MEISSLTDEQEYTQLPLVPPLLPPLLPEAPEGWGIGPNAETVAHGVLRALQHACYDNAERHGFWSGTSLDNPLVKLALITSEVGEAVEAWRKPGPSEHIEGFTAQEEELADIIIRVLDMAGRYNLRLPAAVLAKMKFNVGRPMMHGKRF